MDAERARTERSISRAPALPRKPAKRAATIERLLDWTYREQLAHRYLRRPYDWFLWALDDAGLGAGFDGGRDRRPVHHDAALVHEAVLALGSGPAQLIIRHAAVGQRPERIFGEPRPEWIEPTSRHQKYGWFADAAGRRHDYVIAVAEVVSLDAEPEYRLAGRKKVTLARSAARKRIEVDYCPIGWRPDPAYIAMCNAAAAEWERALIDLQRSLARAPFRAHVLTDRRPDQLTGRSA